MKDPPGGPWQELDPVSRGRVQILPAGRNPLSQARTTVAELLRLAALSPDWDWSRCAVIAREWEYLVPVRAFCEAHGIPAQAGKEEIPNFWRLRETRAFIEWLRGRESRVVDGAALRSRPEAETPGPWHDLLRQAIDEHALETGGGETPVGHFIEWLAEWGRDIRRRQRGLLLLTAHRAKGLEFDHVAILNGGSTRAGRDEDPDDARRLYYVAMTRAPEILALVRFEEPHRLQDALFGNPSAMRRNPAELPPGSAALEYRFVGDDREQTNVLVLAGPGSGKTRVLVHRIAYLVRARRENPRGILALAYNRHAAVDIRRRLAELIGDDARGVTVLTCHALAMRLAGASFTGRSERPDDELFREVLQRAVDLLGGKGLPPEEADERRERLLAGFRWILVDEYQDIGPDQYALISALAGRHSTTRRASLPCSRSATTIRGGAGRRRSGCGRRQIAAGMHQPPAGIRAHRAEGVDAAALLADLEVQREAGRRECRAFGRQRAGSGPGLLRGVD